MRRSRRHATAWLFAGPALLLTGFFIFYPTLHTIGLSLFQGTILNPWRSFTGLDQFVMLFTDDPLFLNLDEGTPSGALVNTFLWLILFTGGTIVLGLYIAVTADRVKYERVLKSIIFLPMVISATAASVIFRFVYSTDENIGILNAVRGGLGFDESIPWLGDESLVNFAVIGGGIWIWTGLAMVVLSAAYKGLPADVYEAASIDGATPRQQFWRITLPMLGKPLAFVATTLIITALKMFDLILIMTNGGPQGASRVIGFSVYWEMFNNNKVGYGSAIAVILLIMVVPVIIVQIRTTKSRMSR